MGNMLNGPKLFVISGSVWENHSDILHLKSFDVSFQGKSKGKIPFKQRCKHVLYQKITLC